MTKNTKIILLIAIIIIILLSLTFALILGRVLNKDPVNVGPGVLPPDYPPMETDPNQEKVEGDQNVAPSTNGGTTTITYTDKAIVDLSDGTIEFMYANTASNQNAVVRISVQDVLIGESQTINPGNKLTVMTLNEDAAKKLQLGTYKGFLVIGFYNPESNEKAMVDGRGEIEVIVQE